MSDQSDQSDQSNQDVLVEEHVDQDRTALDSTEPAAAEDGAGAPGAEAPAGQPEAEATPKVWRDGMKVRMVHRQSYGVVEGKKAQSSYHGGDMIPVRWEKGALVYWDPAFLVPADQPWDKDPAEVSSHGVTSVKGPGIAADHPNAADDPDIYIMQGATWRHDPKYVPDYNPDEAAAKKSAKK